MKRSITKVLFMLALMFTGSLVFAQVKVMGTLTDSKSGETLIGANVLIKGTTIGTITDIDGNYSLTAPSSSSVLVFSYTGYGDKEMTVGTGGTIDIALEQGQFLDEVVVVGYGSQKEKEITSAVVRVTEKEFNKGPISDPTQLLQGKVAGLQVYNRGGDPNQNAIVRLRGISTVGANVEPLVVIDGIIGASLQNVDPSDIATMDVLKDGSASAIYGSRGSSGVIIITTKKGSQGQKVQLSYNGQLGVSSILRKISVMDAAQFKAAGGSDLGSATNFLDEVTQSGTNMVHNLSASGGIGNSTFRVSGNARNTNGILKNTGFDQYNARMNFTTKAFNDKLNLDFSTAFTNKNQQFGFNEALRYAVTYNPTAPVLGENSPFPFNSSQFGNYFETLGLFDSFNPSSIIEQNTNTGKRREFNYGMNASYNILDNLTLNARFAQQNNVFASRQWYPGTSLFRGNATSPFRKGRSDFYDEDYNFKLFETYASHISNVGSANITLTGGYSFQQDNSSNKYLSLGDFPGVAGTDWSNNIGVSQDLRINAGQINANSYLSPDNKIIAFFGRANATIDDAIFLNASVRREGSTKLGEGNKWGLFPALGAGVDLNKYLGFENINVLKVRLGYGVTGALPGQSGLAQPIRNINNSADGGITTTLARAANPDLKWEQKAETNLGVEFATARFRATADLYTRDISDFLSEQPVEVSEFGAPVQWQNSGKLNTRGVELALSYDLVQGAKVNYTTGINLSSYRSVLKEYAFPAQMRANLGAPGQNGTNMIRVAVGENIGQIWGPVYAGINDSGAPLFQDLNGDGQVIAAQDKALDPSGDFQQLGNGLPTLELGWTNELQVAGFNINAFFRGAFGHSLVNNFRAFYEPQISTQTSYNFVNTKLAVAGLNQAQFSSLYVERADFLKLDNLTVSRSIGLGNIKAISNLNIAITGQNLFVITGYTGADPEPALVDYGSSDNGNNAANQFNPDVLSPGIDRRNNYFTSRTFTLGVNFNF